MFYDHADDSVSLMAPRIIRTSAGGDATAKLAGPARGDTKRARIDKQSWMPVLPGEWELHDNIAKRQQAELEIIEMTSTIFNIQMDTDAWESTTAALDTINLKGHLNIETVGMNDAFVRPVVSALDVIIGIIRSLSGLEGLVYKGELGSTKMSHDRTVQALAEKSREGWRGLLVFLVEIIEAATRFTNAFIPFNKIDDMVSENEIMYTVFKSDYTDLIESLRVFTQTTAEPAASIGAYDTVWLLRDRFVSVQTKTNDFVEQAADISMLEKVLNDTKSMVSKTDDVAGIDTLRLAIDTYKYARQTGVDWEQTLFDALKNQFFSGETITMKQARMFIRFANKLDGKKTPKCKDKSIIQIFKQYGITVN
jgi:hypothetical protein